jgi:oxalate decarboxylase/phosphoglucose isomerase-like protein (cupin superfamily)
MEYHTKPGNEPPPHVHEREHELYFLLEGTMRFYCEDKVLRFFGECAPKKWPRVCDIKVEDQAARDSQ